MSDMKADWSGPLKPHNRTTHPVRYYFIDWDLSRYLDPEHGIPSQNPGYGGDRTVPEFQRNELCNPFAVEMCIVWVMSFEEGFFWWLHYTRYWKQRWNAQGTEFGPPRRNVEFLHELIGDTTHDDPSKRPKMTEVVSCFQEIRNGLSWWKLRSRVSNKDIPLIFHILYSPIHWTVQFFRIIRRIPAIPHFIPKESSSSTS